jgi:hypothetical protein
MLPTDTFIRLREKFIADLAVRLRLPTVAALKPRWLSKHITVPR